MYIVALLFLLWCTAGYCEVVLDDGKMTDCTGPSWLCAELANMRRLISEQAQAMTFQKLTIEKLINVIDQLQIKDLETDALYSEQAIKVRQLHNDIAVLKLMIETANLENNAADFKSSDSLVSDIIRRNDDLGPVETVMNQMSQQLTALTADIQTMKITDQLLQNANQQQDLNIQDARTSIFVHWGSSHCPMDSQLVYSGVMGGSHYQQSGGGTNYLCLSLSPVFGTHSLTGQYANLYGTEYETVNDANQDMDAVCAVCRASHTATIMIPGTNVCTQGWTKQYDGYLMAEHRSHSPAQYICVDSVMEGRLGSKVDQNGRLLYFTFTQCGSLPCGPYENNRIVTCAVCSH